MKQIFIAASLALLFTSCKKQSLPAQASTAQIGKISAVAKTAKNDAKKTFSETQLLIQQMTQWAYGKPVSQWPNYDPDGHLQDLGQCSSCGVYFLAGGNFENPYYTRNVTIDLAKYQYIFTGFVSLSSWYDNCDMSTAPKNGQDPEAYFRSIFAEALNGKRDLSLTWDGQDLLSSKQQDYRANSGVFQFAVDPSFYTGCTAETSTWYTDGYFVKLPLTLGQHTLVIGGNFDLKKKFDISAFDLVTYHINVIDTKTP